MMRRINELTMLTDDMSRLKSVSGQTLPNLATNQLFCTSFNKLEEENQVMKEPFDYLMHLLSRDQMVSTNVW